MLAEASMHRPDEARLAGRGSYRPHELIGHLNDVEARSAPERLYTAGWVGHLEAGPRVSIVGSRKASEAGLKRAAKLARLLVSRDVTVVSGLAAGIDAAAHRAAIEVGGRTIAVIGTPLDRAYPRENRELQHLLMEKHLVITQFPEGYPVRRSNFPRRNKVMALISDASVIVEAGETSGSLSQGWEALRLGRPLFLMRSVAEDSHLKWPQEMIGYGAQVLSDENVEVLFDCLPTIAREVELPAF